MGKADSRLLDLYPDFAYATAMRWLGPHLGKARSHAHSQPGLCESVHGRDGLGRPQRTWLLQTHLRFLGWRADLPRPASGDRTRSMVLAQWIKSRTPGP